MCEKEMELEALREKIAIVSKRRDELWRENAVLREEKAWLSRALDMFKRDNLCLIDMKLKLRREKNFWFWACMAMTSVAVFALVMWLGGSV